MTDRRPIPKWVNIYLIGGIQMSEPVFKPLADALRLRFEANQLTAVPRILFPYEEAFPGDLLRQMQAARRDIRLYPEQVDQSVGGEYARRIIKTLGARDPILMVGYGAGGAAAYHAAELLEREGCDIRFVVQVGSPKVPIGFRFKDRVGYIAKKGHWFEGDPQAWQGSWSHARYRFSSHRFPGLLYAAKERGRFLYAPDKVRMLDLAGKIPNYFSPVKGIGAVSNLAKTMNIIWDWFHSARILNE